MVFTMISTQTPSKSQFWPMKGPQGHCLANVGEWGRGLIDIANWKQEEQLTQEESQRDKPTNSTNKLFNKLNINKEANE